MMNDENCKGSEINILYFNQVNSDLEDLVRKLDDWYFEEFGELALKYREHNTLEDIEDIFIAYDEDKPVACVCFKQFDNETAEVKRMYVLPEYRGLGIAESLLKEVIEKAKSKGYGFLVLETGSVMQSAINLYTKFGFQIIQNYGQYEEDTICCLCMKLKI